MNTYTWTHTGRTGARTYQDPARQITGRIVKASGAWSWSVTQWGTVLAAGRADRLRDAKDQAALWIDTATEVTPA